MTLDLTTHLTVPARFAGPPGSANGGYMAGRLAAFVVAQPGPDAAVVTLRRPPPIEAAMDVVRDGDRVEVRHDGQLVAEAAPARLDVDVVPPVSAGEAAAAAQRYRGRELHPFPGCFVCGIAREAGDGLRLEPGSVAPDTVAALWRPHPSLTRDGRTAPEFVWAALDCPGGWAVDLLGRPMVLGRVTGQVEAVPEVGEDVVVMGKLVGQEDRKSFSVTTAYDADSRVLGRASAVWIAVDPATIGHP
ncbi:MAG TPA: hypothetical protein VKP64_15110 [Mycobacteriales bacterium]|nr:hypothetical protein [Mycobacteriales bacterium]